MLQYLAMKILHLTPKCDQRDLLADYYNVTSWLC